MSGCRIRTIIYCDNSDLYQLIRTISILEIDTAEKRETSSTVAFIKIQNAHASLRSSDANMAMISAFKAEEFSNSLSYTRFCREKSRIMIKVGYTYFDDIRMISKNWDNASLSMILGRVRDIYGQERMLVVCYSSQTYEIQGNAEILDPFHNIIITAYLPSPGDNGTFTRSSGLIDCGDRSRSKTPN